MPLTDPYRSTVRERLRRVIGDDSALEALMAELPATDGDAPATNDFVRAEISSLRTEMHQAIGAAQMRLLAILLPFIVAVNAVMVGLVANVK